MSKKLITAAVCVLTVFLSAAAYAANIDVNLYYNNENNSISVKGFAQTVKDNTSFTLLVTNPNDEIVYAAQTVGMSTTEGKTEFCFEDMPLGVTFIGGEYSFAVTGYKLGAAEIKTYTYTDAETVLNSLKQLEELPESADFVQFIKENAVTLSVDSAASEALGKNGTAVFSKLMSGTDYSLPEVCDTIEQYNELQKCAKKFRDDYVRFIAISAFNDISTAADMTAWLEKYCDLYSINADDEKTAEDEAALYKYAERCKNKSEFAAGLIITPISDLDAVKARLYEKALLCTIQTEHYSEATVILRDYYSLFPYNKANYGKLTPTEQTEVYTAFSGKAYATYAAAISEFNRLVNEKLNSRVTGGAGGGGGSSGGSGGGSLSSTSTSGGVVASAENEALRKSFEDIASVDWAVTAIEYLHEKNIISGKEQGVFAPNDDITRAEFIKIITEVFGLSKTAVSDKFSDVDDSDWYAPYVYAARAAGIIEGDIENKFNPLGNITREDIAVIIYRAYKIESTYEKLDFSDSSDISSYAKSAVSYLSGAGIINGVGDNIFAPKANATRAQAAKMIYESIMRWQI